MTTVHFESGDFGATVDLDMMSTLPVNNVRKLLKLLFSDPQRNQEAIQAITSWLPGAVLDAKNATGYTVTLYKDGYRAIPKGYRSPAATEQRKKNRALADSVKFAKADYDRLLKFQIIFNEIKEKKNYA